ncbi:MAG: protein-L-isoaspartate(D-aspartate) O-methyltransferase [Candidatus Aminicenantes bacterium]|nr:protein-L-isoaspartate(D-aspartate) O-methyltransferase [Candidatus Aminicenantes bacterium]
MVESQIAARGVRDPRVLAAMRKVPRHLFVPPGQESRAYDDEPLPIGAGQTISQPYIVAFMTEVLDLRAEDRVLEVGTGSGYQTAVLAEIVRKVFSVEVIEELSRRASRTLERLGYRNIVFRTGDGARGWIEEAPFDAILVAAAPAAVPPALRDQLAVGGRMIIPVGSGAQELVLVRRTERGTEEACVLSVRFVPLI